MKKLLALSIALLSLNLYGAERPIPSKHGLEGWGKKDGGVLLLISVPKEMNPVERGAITGQVSQRLKQSGIRWGASSDYLQISMQPIHNTKSVLLGYSITITPQRKMTFKYDGKEYIAYRSSNKTYGIMAPPNNYKASIDKIMDELLLDHLKANPKK